jgi:hypothetical protein
MVQRYSSILLHIATEMSLSVFQKARTLPQVPLGIFPLDVGAACLS